MAELGAATRESPAAVDSGPREAVPGCPRPGALRADRPLAQKRWRKGNLLELAPACAPRRSNPVLLVPGDPARPRDRFSGLAFTHLTGHEPGPTLAVFQRSPPGPSLLGRLAHLPQAPGTVLPLDSDKRGPLALPLSPRGPHLLQIPTHKKTCFPSLVPWVVTDRGAGELGTGMV